MVILQVSLKRKFKYHRTQQKRVKKKESKRNERENKNTKKIRKKNLARIRKVSANIQAATGGEPDYNSRLSGR